MFKGKPPRPLPKTRTPSSIRWLALAAVAATAPYLPSLRGSFVTDDWGLIVQDRLAHSLALIFRAFGTDFLHGLGDKTPFYYRPLVTVSYQLNYAVAGPDPFVFRLTNVLLHIAAVLAVFAVARRLAGSDLPAGLAALAFAVLPSHAASVAWISGRTDVISTIFVLCALLLFITVYQSRPQFSWPLAILCSLALAGALFSKELGLLAPLLMAGYVWLFGGGIGRRELRNWSVVLLTPLLLYLGMRCAVIGCSAAGYALLMLKERLLCVGIAYAIYLRMLFFPQEVRVMYDVFPYGIAHPAIAVAAWLLPVGLVGISVWLRKREPPISFGCLLVFLALLPVTNILPTIGPVPAEYLVYLASAGSSIVLGSLASKLYLWRPRDLRAWPALSALVIAASLLYCAALTTGSTRVYQSNVSWARAIAATNVRFSTVRSLAGSYLYSAGLLKEADSEYTAAIAFAPPGAAPLRDYVSLAVVKRLLGRPKASIYLLTQCRDHVTDTADLEYQLGIAYAVTADYEDASASFAQAAELDPSFQPAWRNLGRADLKLGRYREAAAAFERAFAHRKPSPKDCLDMAVAYKRSGNVQKARLYLQQAEKPADRR